MQDTLVNLIKHQKVFVGPHFCITKPCLIMVTKVGVLQLPSFLLVFLLPASNLTAMIVAPRIHHTFAGRGAV
jgi:hypothetical protein